MKKNKICLYCMTPKGDVKICPHCGWHKEKEPESPIYLKPGTVLHGKYLVGQVLGHGGFGITYLGWDLNLEIKLAIKEYLPHDLATRPQSELTVTIFKGELREQFDYGMGKFLDEAKALAKFEEFPGIVSVRDFFKDNGTAYFVMNFVEGITLKKYIQQKGGKIPFDQAISILMPVMDAIREVHRHGILHRDISPENIYISENGQVKILDFGAARYTAGDHGRSLSVLLKSGYSPEEQYRSSGKQGPWTDVYAISTTFYRTITGQTPMDALDRLDEDKVNPPSQLGIEISEAQEAALLKGMAVRAKQRFQSVKELQDALTGNVGVSSPEPIPQTHIIRPPTPKPVPHMPSLELESILSEGAQNGQMEPTPLKTKQSEPSTFSNLKIVIPAILGIVLILGVIFFLVYQGGPSKPMLTVITSPSDVDVFIDDNHMGVTPLEVMQLSLGRHAIKLSKVGYEVHVEPIFIKKDVPLHIEKTLVPLLGSLLIDSNPQGAEVFINDQKRGVTPLTLEEIQEGSKKVVIKKADYDTWSTFANIKSNQKSSIFAELRKLGHGTIFQNSVGMKFVYIKPGTFMMGSPLDEPRRHEDEIRHQVTLTQGFFIQDTEVTQAQWKRVVGKDHNPSSFKNMGYNSPVESVSWNDVQNFIDKLNLLEGVDRYRLPTEAEWEYACRAGTDTPFSFGMCITTDQVNYAGEYPFEGCKKGINRNKTMPVASFPANRWGLYDMHGNVWEWCQDWYGSYPEDNLIDPTGPPPGKKPKHVLRGGSWRNSAEGCRSAFRIKNEPNHADNTIGFRLLLSPINN